MGAVSNVIIIKTDKSIALEFLTNTYGQYFAASKGMLFYTALVLSFGAGLHVGETPKLSASPTMHAIIYIAAAPVGFYLLGVALIAAIGAFAAAWEFLAFCWRKITNR